MRSFALVAAILAMTTTAHAGTPPSLSIAAYANSCRAVLSNPADPPESGAPCSYYMGAVADVFTSGILLWPAACREMGADTASMIRVFVDWSDRNPDWGSEHVLKGVLAALSEAYPCR